MRLSPMIPALRTPEERFAHLPGHPFAPHYAEELPGFPGLRMHYLDEGPPEAAETFLCLHGQPTWSYLYRRMVPVFAAAGHRAVAPDFFGFGRSDKPTEEAAYTFAFHRDSLLRLVERLGLRKVTLVVQDWGGLLGLTLPLHDAGLVSRLLIMNTSFATGDLPLGQGFLDWRAWCRANPDMDVARLMARSTPHLTPQECAAYAAPFPDARYKAGVRRFPEMVPDHPDAEGAALSRQAREWWTEAWTGRSFMAIGMRDPVLGPAVMRHLRRHIKGCPEPCEVAEAGHFVQEWGEDVARRALAAL